MKLFRFELKKLLYSPITLLLLLLLTVAGVVQPLLYVHNYRSVNIKYQKKDIPDIIAEYEKYANEPMLEEIEDNLRYNELARERKNLQRVVPDELLIYFDTPIDRLFLISNIQHYREYGYALDKPMFGSSESDSSIRSKQSIRHQISDLTQEGRTDTNEFRALIGRLERMTASDIPGVRYNHFWMKLQDSTGAIMLALAAVFILLVSGVFSREYTAGMYRILASTPSGKCRSMVCKLTACALLGVLTALLMNLLPAAIYLGLGSPVGWDTMLSNLGEGWFTYSPYSLPVYQYFLLKALIDCLAMAVVGALTAWLSLCTRSALHTATISLLLLFTAYGVTFLTDQESVFSLFSLTYALDTRQLFSDYLLYRPFGVPLPYPAALALFLFLLLILFTLLTFRRYTKGTANRVK
ncbi:MAG: ABC transporter permease subunit [Clostridiales bacterium]|nr:ABC transporter permease subunit [Clostridiales bacterium]